MAVVSIASASTITVNAPVMEVSGTTTVDSIAGVFDGQWRILIPTGAWAFSALGNVVASAAANVANVPIILICRNGTLYEIGVRSASPTLTTPFIADFTNAQHDHSDADDGGQIGSSAIAASEKTGTGDIVCAVGPTIDDPTITTRVRLPGPVYIYSGSGTPEGSVTAPIGSTYQRSDGGAGTAFYVKESGSGNTGWVAK